MIFEFDKYRELKSLEEREQLETTLLQIWKSRFLPYSDEILEDLTEDINSDLFQPFMTFDGLKYRPRNFIGFIYSNGNLIEIYPKVFKKSYEADKVTIIRHLHYWFKYCHKLNFPFIESPLENMDIDSFPELIIYLFAKFCLEIISTKPFSRYEEVSEVMTNPRGRIDFKAYISNNVTKGNYHLINCIYEPFVYDNKLNRAIKYVCRLLINQSKFYETQCLLQEIVYILDDVADEPCRASELEQLKINSLFTDYKLIIDWCIRFLEQQMYSPLSYENMQWILLLPMEYIFEDFVVGFLKTNFSDDYHIYSQKSDLYLTENPVAFKMKHDIYLIDKKTEEKIIIIDTKYKPRWDLKTDDKKAGVSQSDMYQMLSYAYRRGCKKVILLYPNAYEELQEDKKYRIKSGFKDNDENIIIYIAEIPFWSLKNFSNISNLLKNKLNSVLNNI